MAKPRLKTICFAGSSNKTRAHKLKETELEHSVKIFSLNMVIINTRYRV